MTYSKTLRSTGMPALGSGGRVVDLCLCSALFVLAAVLSGVRFFHAHGQAWGCAARSPGCCPSFWLLLLRWVICNAFPRRLFVASTGPGVTRAWNRRVRRGLAGLCEELARHDMTGGLGALLGVNGRWAAGRRAWRGLCSLLLLGGTALSSVVGTWRLGGRWARAFRRRSEH